jgi:hypothetical protein
MTRVLLFLGVVTIPFSAIAGFGFLGELAPELSTYFFLLAVCSAMLTIVTPSPAAPERPTMKLLVAIALAAVVIILVSFFLNAASIMTGASHDRPAIDKIVSSSILILYCFALSFSVFSEAGDEWQRVIFMPIAISALFCILFSIFEILSRRMGIATEFFTSLDGMVHVGWNSSVYDKEWDERIRSVAFEAPAFGNYVGFAWPWLTASWVNNRGNSRRGYFVIWLLLTALQLYSPSRTTIVMMGGCAVVLVLLRYIYLPTRAVRISSILVRLTTITLLVAAIAGSLVGLASFNSYEQAVIAGSSVSDITRLAYTEAAFNMFLDHPVFGFGLGQFGFWIREYVPHWGYRSYEITDWLGSGPPVRYWPATYSVYGRLACELGAVGLISWIGLWTVLAGHIFAWSRKYQRMTGLLPAAAHPLIASCFCVLLSGVTTDTLRSPMIWISLGLGCRYLFEVGRYFKPAGSTASHAYLAARNTPKPFHCVMGRPKPQLAALTARQARAKRSVSGMAASLGTRIS